MADLISKLVVNFPTIVNGRCLNPSLIGSLYIEN